MITRQLAIITIFVGFVIVQPVVAEFKYLQSDPIGLATKTPTTVNFVTEIPNNPK
jgi:hypothetical protein